MVIRGEPSKMPIKGDSSSVADRIHSGIPEAMASLAGLIEITAKEGANGIESKPQIKEFHEQNDEDGDRVDAYVEEFGKSVLTGKDEPANESEASETEQGPEQDEGYVPF